MIVIFASSFDVSAVSLAAHWATHDARLLTSNDLSQSGWRHYLNSDSSSTAVISGQVVSISDIDGVLIRWPGVFVEELQQIEASDRNYVAGEMMAFLVSWFSTLRCPVVNRPTPLNLAGPAWRFEQWTNVAAHLGIPVRRLERRVLKDGAPGATAPPDSSVATVTVVNERCFGNVDEVLSSQAKALASAAGVSLLRVSFSGPDAGCVFTGADLIPEISEEINDAVLELLLEPEKLRVAVA